MDVVRNCLKENYRARVMDKVREKDKLKIIFMVSVKYRYIVSYMILIVI